MSNKYIYKLIVVSSLWSTLSWAGATGPEGAPPPEVARQPLRISTNRFVSERDRHLFLVFIQAMRRGDEDMMREIMDGGHALDCLHLPGVTVNGTDVNAFELAAMTNHRGTLLFLLNYARANHVLQDFNLERATQLALDRGHAEVRDLIHAFFAGAVFCSIQ